MRHRKKRVMLLPSLLCQAKTQERASVLQREHSSTSYLHALSLLANVTDMLENMDFNSNKYDDTPYSLIAKQISSLSKPDDAATLQPGMPKAKRHDAYGVCTYRKGADKCTTTGGRKPNGCGFCQGDRRDYVSRTP